MRGDNDAEQSDGGKSGEKWLDSGYIVKDGPKGTFMNQTWNIRKRVNSEVTCSFFFVCFNGYAIKLDEYYFHSG